MTRICNSLLCILPVACLLMLVGCSGDAGDPNLRKLAEELKVSGIEAYSQGNYQQAFDELGTATKGGLNPDLYSEALVYHAAAAIQLDKFDVAQADFELLDQGATNEDQVLAAKSFLAAKQGNKAQAKQLMQQAKRLNRNIKPFGG